MFKSWFGRYGLHAAVGAVLAAGGAACLVWWVPIHVRWYVRSLASDDEVTRLQGRASLVALGPAAVPGLARFRTHPDRRVRQGVAEVLGDIGTEAAIEALAPMIRDRDEAVRQAAAWGLMSDACARHQALVDLRLELDHPDPVVRLCAITLLRPRDWAADVEALIAALDDSDSLIRLAAFRQLRTLTRQTLPFEAFADRRSRAEAVAAWRAWWQAERPRLPAGRADRRTPGLFFSATELFLDASPETGLELISVSGGRGPAPPGGAARAG